MIRPSPSLSIRHEHRLFYPVDWLQLSALVRFRRAGGRCEGCERPHGYEVYHLGDGYWWDAHVAMRKAFGGLFGGSYA